jgi:hypothetical protein
VAFREVTVIEVREALVGRSGAAHGGRAGGGIAKTARRYVQAAMVAGLVRGRGAEQLPMS